MTTAIPAVRRVSLVLTLRTRSVHRLPVQVATAHTYVSIWRAWGAHLVTFGACVLYRHHERVFAVWPRAEHARASFNRRVVPERMGTRRKTSLGCSVTGDMA